MVRGTADAPAGLVTFVFTDIEGSTARFRALGSAYTELLAEHHRIVRSAFLPLGAYEVKTEGDAFFFAFADAPAALEACLRAQLGLAGYLGPDGAPVRVRMGVHTGPAEPVDGDYVALSVHEAARVAGAAHGGQVLLTHVTLEAARHVLPEGCTLTDLGEHGLKDLPAPVLLLQLDHPTLDRAFPPPRSLTATVHNLPAEMTAMIGRTDEVRRVQSMLLGGRRLVTITGSGGAGKTRFALAAAASLLAYFRGGVWNVDLAAISEPDQVIVAIAGAVGLVDRGDRPLTQAVAEALRSGPTLLLLDNFEHVLDGATTVSDLLSACPQMSVLATSREALRLRAEFELRLDRLSLDDAVELFSERALAAGADPVTLELQPDVLQICERVDRLPLALELAAAAVRHQTMSDLLAGLERSLEVLVEGARDLPDRQRTLRSTIAWSADLVGGSARLLLGRLSVFLGGCTGPTAVAVCADDELPESAVWAALRELSDASLLSIELDGSGELRYRLLQTVRDFAGELLADPDAYVTRHLAHFLAAAEDAAARSEGPEQKEAYDGLEHEIGNLRAAMTSSVDPAADALTAARLLAALAGFFFVRGHASEGLAWAERVLHRLPHLPTGEVVAALRETAWLRFMVSDRGADLAEDAVALARECGDPRALARSLCVLASIRSETGQAQAAYDAASEASVVAAGSGDAGTIGRALQEQGNAAHDLGDPVGAHRLMVRALAEFRRLGDARQCARTSMNMAWMSLDLGNLADADAEAAEAAEVYGRLGLRPGRGVSVAVRAWVSTERGDVDAAAAFLTELAVEPEMLEFKGTLMSAAGAAGLVARRRGHDAYALTLLAVAGHGGELSSRHAAAAVREASAELVARLDAGTAARAVADGEAAAPADVATWIGWAVEASATEALSASDGAGDR